MIRHILSDIEGTTSDIAFVHSVLFPYFSNNLEQEWTTLKTWSEFPIALDEIRLDTDAQTDSELITQLLDWVKMDKKQAGLKRLQAKVWETAYVNGSIQGHVYPDVVQAFQKWRENGIAISIYSSGSVFAQQLLFQYSLAGDLRPFISKYFDTQIGHKREQTSYEAIQVQLGIEASEILFLSDIQEELEAAQAAGFQVALSIRSNTALQSRAENFKQIRSFEAINFNPF